MNKNLFLSNKVNQNSEERGENLYFPSKSNLQSEGNVEEIISEFFLFSITTYLLM